MEEITYSSKEHSGGDYVVVGQRDASSKGSTIFVEARIRDDLMNDPHQQVMVSKV
jgi:hypothetical protein